MSLPFLSTPPSCPVIFSECPLHFPCMSRSFVARHFPTSPVVPIGFLVLCFPFILPALPLFSLLSLSCPFQFPFVSLSFPVAFLSCRLPISSPHFLALSCIFPLLLSISRKKTRFFQRFCKGDVEKHRVFPDFRQKEVGNPNQQRAGRGIRAWDPFFGDGTSSNYRAVRGGTPLCSVFQTIDLPQHLAQGPLLHNPSVRTKEPLQAACRIIHQTIHQGQSILQSSITGILDSLRNRSRDQQRPQLPQGSSSLQG